MFKGFSQVMILLLACTMIVPFAGAEEVVIGSRAEPTIDPHFLYLATNVAYGRHVFGRLVEKDVNMNVIPDLATSWEARDENTWVFRLRKGVKFHDGSDFTAEDVIFSFNRIGSIPNNPAPYTSRLKGIISTEAPDPYTVVIKTDKPNPILPALLTEATIVSKRVVEGASTADFNSGKATIGTGPYKFVEFVPGDHYTLERNENYYGAKPDFERVTFKIISNDAARVAALLGGDVDMIDFVPPTEVPHLKKNKKINVFTKSSGRVIYMIPDSIRDTSPFVKAKGGKPIDKNPLMDIRVRKALSMAIDRDAIVSRVMQGLAKPASQLVPEGMYSYNPSIKVTSYDPETAKKLLAQAGYPNGFALTIHGPNDRYVNDSKICQALAQMFARIGLDVEVETMPKSMYFGKMRPPDREFSFCMLGWGNATGEATSVLNSTIHCTDKAKGTGSYNAGYCNPETDKLIEPATETVDAAKRERLLQEAMAYAIERDQAVIPLHSQVCIAATRKGLTYSPGMHEQTLAMRLKKVK